MKEIDKNSFRTVIIPIIFNPNKKQILISRKQGDIDLPKLTWCFPGGRIFHGEDIDAKLKLIVKENTGYNIKNLGAVFAKIYPENKKHLAIYFLCEIFSGKEKIGGEIKELKWVSPEELEKHFTTSFHPRLKEYIINLK